MCEMYIRFWNSDGCSPMLFVIYGLNREVIASTNMCMIHLIIWFFKDVDEANAKESFLLYLS